VAFRDHLRKVGLRSGKDRVVGIKLAISKPEPIVRTGIEPTAMVVLRTVRKHIRRAAEIIGDAINELNQVVGTAVEDRVAGGQIDVELAQASNRRAVIARRRRLRSERIESEIPAVLIELQLAAGVLQIIVDTRGATHPSKRVDELC